MSKQIYLDYNASTPIAPSVADAMRPFLTAHYGNPSSGHWAGRPAREAVDRARAQVADLLGCDAGEVVFTSGGSEANNHAIQGTFLARRDRGQHIITSRVEHPAVIEPCRFLARALGAEITWLPVDRYGRVDPDDVRKAVTPQTVLITIMHANNEVGTLQPIPEISRIAREHEVCFHTDAAQSVGKIDTQVDRLGVDLLSIAGHKLYASKGVGALYVRKGTPLETFVHGAGHEAGRRAGTENVLLLAGLGEACALAKRDPHTDELRALRDRFWDALRDGLGDRVVLNGHQTERLPNTLNVNFVGQIGAELLARLDGVAASTGSACHAGSVTLSPVLEAMHVAPELGKGAVRFSLGRPTTWDELQRVVQNLIAVL